MNFKGEIVDFIAQSDSAVIQAVHKRDINERIETFDFTILSERTTYMQERNRIVIQDKTVSIANLLSIEFQQILRDIPKSRRSRRTLKI